MRSESAIIKGIHQIVHPREKWDSTREKDAWHYIQLFVPDATTAVLHGRVLSASFLVRSPVRQGVARMRSLAGPVCDE
jgi:hypothetical protein